MKTIKSNRAFFFCGRKRQCLLQTLENKLATVQHFSESWCSWPFEIAHRTLLWPCVQNTRNEIRARTQSRYCCRAVRWHASMHVKKRVSGTSPGRAIRDHPQFMWTEQLHIQEGPRHRPSSWQKQKEATETGRLSELRQSCWSSRQTGDSVGDSGYGTTLDTISLSMWRDLFILEGWLVWLWGLGGRSNGSSQFLAVNL